MPGEEWPCMKTMSPGCFSDGARQKWLNPTSYKVADEAYLDKCPPYSDDTRLACTTIAIAFQRKYASMRRSSARLPGYSGSRPVGILLTYAVFGLNGRYAPLRRV